MSTINLDLSSTALHLPEPVSAKRRPFLTPLPEPGHFLAVFDNTALEKIKRCHVTGQNYLVLQREAHAKTAALTFGGAIHAGLELFLYHQWAGYTGPVVEDEATTAENLAVSTYFLNNPAPPDKYRTLANAIEVLKHYRDRSNHLLYPDYEWEILANADGPLIEKAFELPLGVLEVGAHIQMPWLSREIIFNLNSAQDQKDYQDAVFVSHIHLAWSGRIDAIARTHSHTCIVDHKTTSIVGDQFTQSFQLSSQVMGYAWAANQLFPDLGPFAFCFNAIALKKPGIGQGLMSRGPKGGEPPLSFFRAFFPNTTDGFYTPERLESWRYDTVTFLEDFIHSVVRNHFPMNDRQCFDKYGQCPYHGVCTIDNPVVRRKLLMSEAFKDVTWNPLAK